MSGEVRRKYEINFDLRMADLENIIRQRILKGDCIMVNANNLTQSQMEELAFTKEQLEELERARNMPITFDEDCPETTLERAVKFRRVNTPGKHTDSQLV